MLVLVESRGGCTPWMATSSPGYLHGRRQLVAPPDRLHYNQQVLELL